MTSLKKTKKTVNRAECIEEYSIYAVLVIVLGSIISLSILIYNVALWKEGANISDGVLIAFISASAIQAFALLSIVARSLFPALPLLPSKREVKEEE